jgi:hypothetical protein
MPTRLITFMCGMFLSALSLGQTLDTQSAYQAELRADAASRTSWAEGGAGAGFVNNRFSLYDADKDNLFWIGGQLQFRYTANFRRNDSAPEAHDEFTHGFSERRTRLRFGGNVWDKNLTYFVHIESSRSDGSWTLLDGFGQYRWSNGIGVRWGQFKAPFMREELVADSVTLMVETSTMQNVFTIGRTQGVQLDYTEGNIRLLGAFTDGPNAVRTDFDSSRETDLAFTGRLDYLFAGEDFKRFEDMTSFRGSTYSGGVAIAGHYDSGGETGGTLDRERIQALVETYVEGSGFNAMVAGVWRRLDDDSLTDSQAFDDFGIVVQGGYFVTDQVELIARYDVVLMDGDRSVAPDGDDSFHTVAAGFNYYVSPESLAVKLTCDLQYFFNSELDVEIVNPTTGTGLLADPDDGQVAFRAQMQIQF